MAAPCGLVVVFWASLLAVAYPYLVYPLLLVAWNRLTLRRAPAPQPGHQPTVTVICPVHDEAARIEDKVRNLLALDYPPDRMQILVVGDGCTDRSLELALLEGQGRVEVVDLSERRGKAAALNAGLERADGEIVMFTDAGIVLEPGSLAALAGHFANPEVGCVSGEDAIEGGGGEGLYGKLELLLRREEARLHSIAGASGCLYAMRRSLCRPFRAGMAPDFLSVLDTVRAGFRALAEPAARGTMTATASTGAEYRRKTRTFLRGITALFGNAALLNPFRHPAFSFILVSHKLMRWLAFVPLAACFVAAFLLRAEPVYALAFYGQLALYALAGLGLQSQLVAQRSPLIRLAAFFVLVNAAAARALGQWLAGVRQEVWEPTRRPA
ncbi:MAG TPA: glycosyltransferase [Steroidobacteraceae bacterium]|nr:glycosyltransferase [Steroidobacteraceae bacterium]